MRDAFQPERLLQVRRGRNRARVPGGVPADAREAYEKASAVARGAGLDELAARARNGAEGKAGAADMIDGG